MFVIYRVIYIVCSKGGATDRYNFRIKLYKDVRSILDDLKDLGIPIAAASRYDHITMIT